MSNHARRILAVDDDPQLLALLQEILHADGYTNIRTAASGREALALMREKPELILLDVMLPDMSGFELMRSVRAAGSIPVIFLTARGEDEDKFSAFHLGADDYLVKPFLPRELLFRIAAVLRRVYPERPGRFALPACEVDLSRAVVLRCAADAKSRSPPKSMRSCKSSSRTRGGSSPWAACARRPAASCTRVMKARS